MTIDWQWLSDCEKYPNPETMLRHRMLVQKWSAGRLAKHLGVCETTVLGKARSYGIPINLRGGPNYRAYAQLDKEQVISLYYDDHLTQEQIAKRCRVCARTINKAMKRWGVSPGPCRNPSGFWRIPERPDMGGVE